ncbi:MAG: hypothetical protein IKB15_00735 [Alistipes sp.]|nr:hypothetical protein [Alistipes sp.]
MKSREQIAELVEKFLDGRTTNSEERELYAWFGSAEVPEEWSDLKAMFAWYEAGMPEQKLSRQAETPRSRRSMWLTIGSVAGIAASVALIITLILPDVDDYVDATHLKHQQSDIYKGSYIVEHGVRSDDLSYIEGDIEELLERADNLEQRADELLAWADI